jgi:uncharacterized membrane protein YsdA (DUF1294 family)
MNPRLHQGQPRSSFSAATVLVLIVLLLFPALTSLRLAQSFDPRVVFGYLIAISAITFWLYWHDKRRAEAGGWRTPESTLHLVEFLGGWPVAFLAQRAFRHKISKIRYQVVFWAIVAFQEAASFDFLSEWHYSQAAIKLLRQ